MSSITLANDLRSVSLARQFVRSQISEQDFDEWTAVLLTSELVAGVVCRSGCEVTVLVSLDPCLRVGVQDRAAATDAYREIVFSPMTPIRTHAESGRGLPIVRLLASRFGLEAAPGSLDARIVWFELDHTGESGVS